MTKTPKDFAWAFGRDTYTAIGAFLAEFTDYNCEIMKMKQPIGDFILSEEPSISLHFQGVPEGEDDYNDISVTITSRNGGPLLFLEFMFLANNAVHPYLCNADHVFFEGHSEAGDIDGTPAFLMRQGS